MPGFVVRCIIAAAALLAASPGDARPYGEPTIATTPQVTATNSVGGTVVRTNVVGSYAVVLIHGGQYESPPEDLMILTEHFLSGWQSIAIVYDDCDFTRLIGNAATRAALLRDMLPTHHGPEPCRAVPGGEHDIGSATDIAAIRSLELAALVPSVVVVDPYALGQWAGGGGGPHLFEKTNGRWNLVAGTGGEADAEWLASKGVPERYRCALLYNFIRCPTSR